MFFDAFRIAGDGAENIWHYLRKFKRCRKSTFISSWRKEFIGIDKCVISGKAKEFTSKAEFKGK